MYHERSLRGAVGAPTQASELDEKESYTESSPGEQGAAIAHRRVADAIVEALDAGNPASVLDAAAKIQMYLTAAERVALLTASMLSVDAATVEAVFGELYPEAGPPVPAFDDVAPRRSSGLRSPISPS